MKGIMNWFTNKLAPGMQKVFSNPWIAAVASAMQKILPFILVGSVISILQCICTLHSITTGLEFC